MNFKERMIFAKALKTYGETAQIFMVMEEVAELQKELCKNQRGKSNRREIAEEVADVEIMLDQMKVLHNIEEMTVEARNSKVARLNRRLEGLE